MGSIASELFQVRFFLFTRRRAADETSHTLYEHVFFLIIHMYYLWAAFTNKGGRTWSGLASALPPEIISLPQYGVQPKKYIVSMPFFCSPSQFDHAI